MTGSKTKFARAKKSIAGGVNSPVRYYAPYPFFAQSARGGNIRDADGRTYVDYCCAYGALLLGHRNKAVISAVKSQLENGTLYCVPTAKETELAEMVCKAYPSIKRLRLLNSGMEATMSAIRLARAHTKRQKIIKFEGGYHGAHDYALVNAGSGVAHSGIAGTDGALEQAAKNTLVAKYNDLHSLESAMSNNVAAVILEPVMANAGLVLPQKRFLQNVIRLAHSHGVLVIFDETVTGFRMALGGAQEYYGVRADITTLAKALGGGFAISALGGRADLMDTIAPAGPVYIASTFAGNPVSVSASVAALQEMRRGGKAMYSKLERTASSLASHISDLACDMGVKSQVNTISSMLQLYFTDKPVTDYTSAKRSNATTFVRLATALRKRGVFVPPSQFEVMFVSAAHTSKDIERTKNAFEGALREVKN